MIIQNHTYLLLNIQTTIPNTSELQSSFIGLIATIIAILFSILITIVANSSSKYPSNFIEELKKDLWTIVLYFEFGAIILFEIILFHLKFSDIWFDLTIIIIIFTSLFLYWRHILNVIDPEVAIGKIKETRWTEGEKTKDEIKLIGDYVKIGLEKENDVMKNKAFEKLKNFNMELKKDD